MKKKKDGSEKSNAPPPPQLGRKLGKGGLGGSTESICLIFCRVLHRPLTNDPVLPGQLSPDSHMQQKWTDLCLQADSRPHTGHGQGGRNEWQYGQPTGSAGWGRRAEYKVSPKERPWASVLRPRIPPSPLDWAPVVSQDYWLQVLSLKLSPGPKHLMSTLHAKHSVKY